MPLSNADRLRAGLLKFLVGLVRPLIRSGVGYDEFCAAAAEAYVTVAAADLGLRDRPANDSRISSATNISRKKVASIKKRLREKSIPVDLRPPAPARIISKWMADSRFCSAKDCPNILRFKSDDGRSFEDLAKSVRADLGPHVLRDELIRAGCARQVADGRIELVRAFYVNPRLELRIANALEEGLLKHVQTVDHNTQDVDAGSARFERIQYIKVLAPDTDPEVIDRVATRHLQRVESGIRTLLEAFEYRDEMTHSDADSNVGHAVAGTVGIGLYYFRDSS